MTKTINTNQEKQASCALIAQGERGRGLKAARSQMSEVKQSSSSCLDLSSREVPENSIFFFFSGGHSKPFPALQYRKLVPSYGRVIYKVA